MVGPVPHPILPPAELYRGVCRPLEAITDDFLVSTLVPGTKEVNEQGELVVADGNEYGVYMTDNRSMAEAAYSQPLHAQPVEGGLRFRHRGMLQVPERPTVGVLYAISTSGLNVREPKINGPMKGHYNNGFAGREWIADSIPAANYQVLRLTLGPATLSRVEHFPVRNGDLSGALQELHDSAQAYEQRLGVFMMQLSGLDERQRLNEFRVGDLVRAHTVIRI